MSGVYHEEIKKVEHEDAQGNITVDTAVITKAMKKRAEPDYIKLYTRMWCEFNAVPDRYRRLFLELALRMSYANLDKGGDVNKGGQIVYVIGPARQELLDACGWRKDDALCKGLKALVDCNAIKKISRGVYQVNPQYAGRGKWAYNAKEQQGGIENLIATFNFRKKDVDTSIIWASGDPSDAQTVVTHTTIEDEIANIGYEIRNDIDGVYTRARDYDKMKAS